MAEVAMVALGFRFIAGRYHATPWGRHVNEADIAWPPDVWRLARALVATWHRKVDPSLYPRDVLESLLAALAADPPLYRLPKAVHAHTRHYMPAREGKKDKKTLVFDAFIRVDPRDELVVVWPDVVLDDTRQALLDILLERLGYLGRAESWVEARSMPRLEGKSNCRPVGISADLGAGEIDGEMVRLLVPRTPENYAAFRGPELDALEARNLRPLARRRIMATLPENWLDAVALDTGELQQAGWSQPPAARVVTYVRPEGCLMTTAPPTRRQPVREAPPATTARYALYGKPLPRIEEAVRVGEWMRAAAMGRARRLFSEDAIPPLLSGHDRPKGHRHAFYLPEDADGDGYVDHVVIHAPQGFDATSLQVLGNLRRLWTREGYEWQLVLEDVADVSAFVLTSQLLGSGTTWISVSPYLHPWHAKRKFTIEDQIQRECRERGLPALAGLERLADIGTNGRQRRPVHFRRVRSKRGLTQPDTRGSFWRIAFETPISGPLALGFGCHFGLGLFRWESG